MRTPPPSARLRLVLQLGCGALLLIGAAWLFGAIAEDVVTGGRLTRIDSQIAQWLHEGATPAMTRWVLIFTNLNSTFAIAWYSLIAALAFYLRRQRRGLVTLLFGVGGGLIVNELMKLAFHRSRPVFEQPLLSLSSYSFPSGHVAASTIFYGLLVAYLFMKTRALHWRLLALLTAAIIVAAVAFTRLYLGVHYLSDVMAAFAEGVAWLALTLSAIAAFWRKSEATPTQHAGLRALP